MMRKCLGKGRGHWLAWSKLLEQRCVTLHHLGTGGPAFDGKICRVYEVNFAKQFSAGETATSSHWSQSERIK